jgi:hypothetical protein
LPARSGLGEVLLPAICRSAVSTVDDSLHLHQDVFILVCMSLRFEFAA